MDCCLIMETVMSKTVIITGSTRGLGFMLARAFRKHDCNVMLNGRSDDAVRLTAEKLSALPGSGRIAGYACDVSSPEGLQSLWDQTAAAFGSVDIWVNNAGINQPEAPLWELAKDEIDRIIDVDLKGAVCGSSVAMRGMKAQGGGAIYNLEGHGSDDSVVPGISMYGTAKRAVTYFTRALAKEAEAEHNHVIVGRLSPGIMITDFLTRPLGGSDTTELPEKTRRVYNILGDRPDVVADFLVKQMLANRKNDAHIVWLTGRKAVWRFMTSRLRKRDFFSDTSVK